MISGGKINPADSVRKVFEPCLRGLDPAFKAEVKAALDGYCNSADAKAPDSRSGLYTRAKAFGSAGQYAVSSSPEPFVARLFEMPPAVSGPLLAALVKKVFTNEGGTNG
ncbi:MAG: hypothetical protein Q8P84_06565 [Deltaproteobacteria bacterium]|nr:hypothetical protein [Deltaproteobacteria bacterium]